MSLVIEPILMEYKMINSITEHRKELCLSRLLVLPLVEITWPWSNYQEGLTSHLKVEDGTPLGQSSGITVAH